MSSTEAGAIRFPRPGRSGPGGPRFSARSWVASGGTLAWVIARDPARAARTGCGPDSRMGQTAAVAGWMRSFSPFPTTPSNRSPRRWPEESRAATLSTSRGPSAATLSRACDARGRRLPRSIRSARSPAPKPTTGRGPWSRSRETRSRRPRGALWPLGSAPALIVSPRRTAASTTPPPRSPRGAPRRSSRPRCAAGSAIGIPEEVARETLAGLSSRAAAAVARHPLEEAFTGAVARRDAGTVRGHLAALARDPKRSSSTGCWPRRRCAAPPASGARRKSGESSRSENSLAGKNPTSS